MTDPTHVFSDLAPGTYTYDINSPSYHDPSGTIKIIDQDVIINLDLGSPKV